MLYKNLKRVSIITGLFLISGLAQAGMASVSKRKINSMSTQQAVTLDARVQHALLMLPYYGVFDELTCKVQGNTVILAGEVTGDLLKSEAERAARNVNGVANVINKIEILPPSSMDDSIRLMTFRAIYSQPGFEKYEFCAIKPIHIIVDGGHVTLVGVVSNEFDKTMADLAARNVPFTFFVTDDLAVG